MTEAADKSCADKPRVMIVEDDVDIRDTLAETLEYEGYAVDVSADGVEALDLLRTTTCRPCLILLDLMMPNMDGYAFRKEQLRNPDWANIPVAVVTADGNAIEKAAAVGAAGYLRKPMRISALLALVERFCTNGAATAPRVDEG